MFLGGKFPLNISEQTAQSDSFLSSIKIMYLHFLKNFSFQKHFFLSTFFLSINCHFCQKDSVLPSIKFNGYAELFKKKRSSFKKKEKRVTLLIRKGKWGKKGRIIIIDTRDAEDKANH